MPAKNVVKQFGTDQYYHAYNRGVAKRRIFLDDVDKHFFLGLVDRHLNPANTKTDALGIPYRKFNETLELLSFCLMDNHFHFLFYQGNDVNAMSEFMRSIGTAYSMYFNRKYERVGPLFQGTYKASRIMNDAYLMHISRYIHLNPPAYLYYPYSSLSAYLGRTAFPWLTPERILALFEDIDYLSFLKEYEAQHQILAEIKRELANA